MQLKRLSREESRERTRERILDAAARLFVKHGFDGASIDDITAAAGYTKGAFYANFPSKEDVFLALMERHGRQSGAARSQLVVPGRDANAVRADLKKHIREHAREWDWLMLGIEFKLAAARNPKLRSKFAAVRRALIAHAAAELEGFSALLNQPLSAPPESLCTAIEVLIEGLALLHKVDGDALRVEQADAILDLFVDRLLLHGDPPSGGRRS